MARVSRGGGGNGGRRMARPSADELMKTLRRGFEDEFIGIPLTQSTAEFNKATKSMFDPTQSLDYFLFDEDRVDYRNLAGRNADSDTAWGRQFYEVDDLTGDLVIPGEVVSPFSDEEDTSPAPLTLVPTSTSNPKRPRTVAAGYDEDEQKLTVVFRDGTFYNYYDVDKTEWEVFKANRSKGAVIYRMLDFKPRGPADDSSISQSARAAYYQYSRGVQVSQKGKLSGQGGTSYKTKAQGKKGRKR
jgi:hypothetical protein